MFVKRLSVHFSAQSRIFSKIKFYHEDKSDESMFVE